MNRGVGAYHYDDDAAVMHLAFAGVVCYVCLIVGTSYAAGLHDQGVQVLEPEHEPEMGERTGTMTGTDADLLAALHTIQELKAQVAGVRMDAEEKIGQLKVELSHTKREFKLAGARLKDGAETTSHLAKENAELKASLADANTKSAALFANVTYLSTEKAQVTAALREIQKDNQNQERQLEAALGNAKQESEENMKIYVATEEELLKMQINEQTAEEVREAVRKLATAAKSAQEASGNLAAVSTERLHAIETQLEQERSSNVKLLTKLTTVEARNAQMTANKAVSDTVISEKLEAAKNATMACEDASEHESEAAQVHCMQSYHRASPLSQCLA